MHSWISSGFVMAALLRNSQARVETLLMTGMLRQLAAADPGNEHVAGMWK